MKTRAVVALCASLGLSAAVTSVTHADEGAKKPLTPEVAITMRTPSDLHFSPDGKRLAFVLNDPLKGTGRKRHIWVLDVATKQARQFTFSENQRVRPDGRPTVTLLPSFRIAEMKTRFTSSRRTVAKRRRSPKASAASIHSPGRLTASKSPSSRQNRKRTKRRKRRRTRTMLASSTRTISPQASGSSTSTRTRRAP